MFREIINIFAGKRKIIDESMDFPAVYGLLSKLDRTTIMTLDFDSCGHHRKIFSNEFDDAIYIAEFIREEFEPSPLRYFKGHHQVFYSKENERHYLDLQAGKIEKRFGRRDSIRDSIKDPYTIATLDFFL